jgi:hypothetical protein
MHRKYSFERVVAMGRAELLERIRTAMDDVISRLAVG